MTDETVSRPWSMGVPALRAVSLVGFMGAGKTTVGRALAARLGWRFEDLDDLIQAREGRSIQQIFHQQGESGFRDLECRVMREILAEAESAPLVFALGGGAYLEQKVREALREAEIPAVFLDASVEELFRRSEQPEVVRPMRRDREHFRQLYERRRAAYLEAKMCIATEGKAIREVVDEIISGLSLAPRSDQGSGVCE